MSKTILRLTGITIAAAGLVGLTATAAGAHEASQIGGSYHLTIRDNDGERAAATLTCYPHGGSHPAPTRLAHSWKPSGATSPPCPRTPDPAR